MSMCALCAPILAALLSLAPVPAASASNGMEWALERWEGDGPARPDIGAPESTRAPPQLPRIPASRPWTLCAVYPHLKDSYWLAVNYGMVDEARALGLGLRVLMGKGYENLESQRAGVSDCIADTRTDALLVGTVSFAGLNDLLRPYAAQHPVLGLVNDIDASVVSSRVGVPWYQLGWQIGRWLAERHPAGSAEATMAWLPGPLEASWVNFVDRGFRAALDGSAVRIVVVSGGDTGRSIQRQLIEAVLDAHPRLDYLVGNAPMAEAAIAELRRRGREDSVGIIASYITPGVHSGLARGRIRVSVSDFPVLQGRLAVRQALHLLEGRAVEPYLGPRVERLDADNLAQYPLDWMLPPAGFVPIYEVIPVEPEKPRTTTPARP